MVMLISLGSSFATDVNINLTVNYDDSSDSINPTILINDMNKNPVYFNKTSNLKKHKLDFKTNNTEDTADYNVTIKAPGYKDLNTILKTYKVGDNYVLDDSRTLLAKTNYKLGKDVVKRADMEVGGFNRYDKVLFLTTGGYIDNKDGSTEVSADAVINYFEQKYPDKKLSMGNGNVFLLRERANGPLNFYFVLKKGDKLSAISFENGNTYPTKINGKTIANVREDMSRSEWESLDNALGERAFTVASMANAWAKEGKSKVDLDLLTAAASHGHVCIGTISGYAMSQTLLKYYPPGDFSTEHPTEKANYLVIGVPGESDDDALTHFLDSTPGKFSYTGVDTTQQGAYATMAGFLVWYEFGERENTGDLIVLSFDKEKLNAQFKKETGFSTELQFNSWLLGKLAKNPQDLVNIDYTFYNISPEQKLYIVGAEKPTTFAYNNGTNLTLPSQKAHGLDINTIKSWNLDEVKKVTNNYVPTKVSSAFIEKLGYKSADLAIDYFKKAGINLEKDLTNLVVSSSAGFVKLNNSDTTPLRIGFEDRLGSRLTRGTLLPFHRAFWKPLWVSVSLEDSDGIAIHTLYMVYNATKGDWVPVANDEKVTTNIYEKYINDMSGHALNNFTTDTQIAKVLGSEYMSICTIINAWHKDPPYSLLLSYLFHNHNCPGVAPGYGITEYIFEEFPLTKESQRYIYVGNSLYCKDDGIISRLGVSPGLGSYYANRLTSDEYADGEGGAMEGFLIVWDDETQTGDLHSISYKWPVINPEDHNTFISRFIDWSGAFVDMANGIEPESMIENEKVWNTFSKEIDEEIFKKVTSGSETNMVKYLKSLPDKLDKRPDTPSTGSKINGTSSNPTSTDSSRNPSSGVSPGQNPTSVVSAISEPTSDASANEAGDKPKTSAYEVEKTQPEPKSNNSLPLTVLAIVIICALVGLGYWYYTSRSDNS